jgi:hypothetical protein
MRDVAVAILTGYSLDHVGYSRQTRIYCTSRKWYPSGRYREITTALHDL